MTTFKPGDTVRCNPKAEINVDSPVKWLEGHTLTVLRVGDTYPHYLYFDDQSNTGWFPGRFELAPPEAVKEPAAYVVLAPENRVLAGFNTEAMALAGATERSRSTPGRVYRVAAVYSTHEVQTPLPEKPVAEVKKL